MTSEDSSSSAKAQNNPCSTAEAEVPPPAPACSGFLIDDCDEEEQPPPPTPPPPPSAPIVPPFTPEETVPDPATDIANQESRVLLLHELDDADAEQRKELKRQKRLQRKLKLNKTTNPATENKTEQTVTESEPTSTTMNLQDRVESSSDWVIEYENEARDSVSKLTDEIRQTTSAMTPEERTEKMNLILMRIKRQQEELKKLRQYVMSVLGEDTQRNSTSKKRSNINVTQDLLLALLNQPTPNSCWLCSGKLYSEVGTQSDGPTAEL